MAPYPRFSDPRLTQQYWSLIEAVTEVDSKRIGRSGIFLQLVRDGARASPDSGRTARGNPEARFASAREWTTDSTI